jgi:hypothetical protein
MRLVMISLAAMTASTMCVALLFLYALVVPTRPAPEAALVRLPDPAWSGGPVEQPVLTVASDLPSQ